MISFVGFALVMIHIEGVNVFQEFPFLKVKVKLMELQWSWRYNGMVIQVLYLMLRQDLVLHYLYRYKDGFTKTNLVILVSSDH